MSNNYAPIVKVVSGVHAETEKNKLKIITFYMQNVSKTDYGNIIN